MQNSNINQNPSIEDFQNSMTIYYWKKDGNIHSYCTGISDMSTFGNYADEYALILDYVILPLDRTVLTYLNQFYIDLETKQVKIRQDNDFDFTKYQ